MIKICPAFPEGRFKAFTLSYDDGNDCDAPLVEMMRRFGVKGTFNVNAGLLYEEGQPLGPEPWRRMTAEEAVSLYGNDMEIAIHGFRHPKWKQMSGGPLMYDILEDKRTLERISGKIIRGAAAPYGSWNEQTLEILRLAGFRYCRSKAGRGTESLAMWEDDPFLLDGTAHHDNPRLFELAERFVQDRSGTPKLFYVWGHSYEFVENDNWGRMEELLKKTGGRDDVWYATNLEIFDYWHAVQNLLYSADERRVCNPFAQDVWLRVYPKGPLYAWMKAHRSLSETASVTVKIPAGQTVDLPD
jgi:hypothetical protein